MAPKSFSADVRLFMAKSKAKMTEIMQDSVFDLIELAQTPQVGITAPNSDGNWVEGKIPVVSRDLIGSLATELNGGGFGSPSDASYSAVIAQMQPGGVIRFNWTMPYAMGLEVGYTTSLGNEVGGRHWVSFNAEKWDEIVKANVQRIAI